MTGVFQEKQHQGESLSIYVRSPTPSREGLETGGRKASLLQLEGSASREKGLTSSSRGRCESLEKRGVRMRG